MQYILHVFMKLNMDWGSKSQGRRLQWAKVKDILKEVAMSQSKRHFSDIPSDADTYHLVLTPYMMLEQILLLDEQIVCLD
jgi:hypothetical protein